jgi:hypothetical protein
MGQEILYCFKCQERVTSADLEASKGLRFGVRTACRKCVPDLLATLTEREKSELAGRAQAPPVQDPRTSTGKYVLSTATPRSRSIPAASGRPASGSNAVGMAAVGVAVIAIAGALLLLNSGESGPPREKPSSLPTPKPSTENGRDRAAREALERAKSLPASDLDAQVSAYAQALRLAEGTSYEREARERHEGMLEMRRRAYARELAVLDERARALLGKEEFGSSLALFESARALHSGPEWKESIEARIAQHRNSVDAAYADLKARATLAKGKGAGDDVKALRERVSRWGVPDLAKDLEAQLASIAPPVETRPWTPLFDGASLDFLVSKGEGAWIVENGAIVHVKDRNESAQTKRHFTDGEIRIVFEGRQMQDLGFAIRQGASYFAVVWNRAELGSMEGQTQELVFVFRGDEVLATLNGTPRKIEIIGKPALSGPLQWNSHGEYFLIKSIEFREPGLEDGLVGHWSFDSITGTSTPDSSPFKNDALLVDGPVVVPGRIGTALEFDGRRSHVAVASKPCLNLTGPFTLSAWVKPAGPERRSCGIVEKWDNGPKQTIDGYFLRLTGDGRPHLVVSEPAEGGEVAGQKPLPLGEWSFLAGVSDGTEYRIYVNGSLDRKLPGIKGPRRSTNPLRIGMAGGDGGQYFQGAIDDVRIYARALSAAEIARLAQGK